MLNIKDLEEKHKRYKLKSYVPYIFIIILLIIILIILFNTIYNNKKVTVEEKVISLPVEKIIVKKIEKEIVEKIPELNTTKEIKKTKEVLIEAPKTVVIEPSLNFLRRINTPVEVIDNSTNKKSTIVNKIEPKKETIIEEVISIPSVEKKQERDLIIEKKRDINIEINKDQEDIQHVISRFKINNNPALSLFIAKKYYQLGDYHKSYNYALITNQLNRNIEASWIIFTKSLMKLKKEDKAIKTLKKYIDSSHSPRAKILLDEIQSGKFK